MLREWRLKNFKSYYGEHKLPLSSLTLLCGSNSSGKSSIIQSVLLIKQTLQHTPVDRPIALNGPLVRLGTFTDIWNFTAQEKGEDDSILIGWRLADAIGIGATSAMIMPFSGRIENIDIDFELDTKGPTADGQAIDIQPTLKKVSISSSFIDLEQAEHALTLSIRRSSKRGRRPLFDESAFENTARPFEFVVESIDAETKGRLADRPSGKLLGCIPSHFFPGSLVLRFDRNRALAHAAAANITGPARVAFPRPGAIAAARHPRLTTRRTGSIMSFSVPDDVARLLEEIVRINVSSDAHGEDLIRQLFRPTNDQALTIADWNGRLAALAPTARRRLQLILSEYTDKIEHMIYARLGRCLSIQPVKDELVNVAGSEISNFFKFRLSYLGPLRDDPKPLYPLQALQTPTDVGGKGELTAAVLHLNQSLWIEYVPSAAFGLDKFERRTVRGSLRQAVADWLNYLGIAVAIETSEKGKFGHELRVQVTKSSGFQDLTNVGVGVSQVLPIVVMCLLAQPGATLILEQPELHLHPAVQARLADFFISMTALRKQVLIETHGEYLVERIRLRIVSDLEDKLLQDTKIYFFEQRSGNTQCRDIPLTRYGVIEDWPDDFFDQSQRESERIVMKALERRKIERVH